MERIRKPYQGVWNIVRFNWHFYALSIVSIIILLLAGLWLDERLALILKVISFLIGITTIVSLLASYYVYDLSGLYSFKWLPKSLLVEKGTLLNINAGFDETSTILRNKFPDAELIVFDFYDPKHHTEISIKRARKAYPPYSETKTVNTSDLPLESSSIDTIFVILAAHEIRVESERNAFFKELNRVLKPGGNIVVVEHLRDIANFLVYNIGFFHFIPKKLWLRCFSIADFKVSKEIKITPFISAFILQKNGTAS